MRQFRSCIKAEYISNKNSFKRKMQPLTFIKNLFYSPSCTYFDHWPMSVKFHCHNDQKHHRLTPVRHLNRMAQQHQNNPPLPVCLQVKELLSFVRWLEKATRLPLLDNTGTDNLLQAIMIMSLVTQLKDCVWHTDTASKQRGAGWYTAKSNATTEGEYITHHSETCVSWSYKQCKNDCVLQTLS